MVKVNCTLELAVEAQKGSGGKTLRCVIPVVCVTNDREESVVNQHN